MKINKLTGAAIALCLCLSGCLSDDGPRTSGNIKVLTYNIHHGVGTDNKLNLYRIANVINSANVDTVALQEVDYKVKRSGFMDTAQYLAVRLNMNPLFSPAMNLEGGTYGNAILSRYPLTFVERVQLPAKAGTEPRIALIGYIEAPVPYFFASLHLPWEPDQADIRVECIKYLERHIKEKAYYPIVVCGDFNSDVSTPEIAELRKNFVIANDKNFVITCYESNATLDYIAAYPKENFTVKSLDIISDYKASDHFPVRAELNIRKPLY